MQTLAIHIVKQDALFGVAIYLWSITSASKAYIHIFITTICMQVASTHSFAIFQSIARILLATYCYRWAKEIACFTEATSSQCDYRIYIDSGKPMM